MRVFARCLLSRPAGILLLIFCASAGAPRPASAAMEGPAGARQATFRLAIPAGPLTSVIPAFETATGTTVVVPAGATLDGLSSPGVSGAYTAGEALAKILSGTGLTFRLARAGTYALEVAFVADSVDVRGRTPYQPAAPLESMRTAGPLRDVPQSVTIVTATAIADMAMQTMGDVVRYVPGVGMSQGEGHRDAPILRGSSTTADFFVDGIRDDVQYFRDLYNVEQVEVLKGPNAMLFGRGGAGGIINRTTRRADWGTAREVTLQAGTNDTGRVTFDVDQPMNASIAGRLTGMYENSESYRQAVGLERYAFNPTLAFMLGDTTTLRVGYEYFHDDRTVDRGVPSYDGRPLDVDPSTFFGDPQASRARATVNALSGALDHSFRNGVRLRNRTRFADYGKFYQNVFPGSVNAARTMVSLSAYNNATDRQNVFNQTDVNFAARTGRIRHQLLAGAEFGRQVSDNLRQTGYFETAAGVVTGFPVAIGAPALRTPVLFRQSPTDADNHGVATVAAVYVQDEIALTRALQAVVGLRYDRFAVDFRDNRTAAEFESTDNLLSPRAGLIYKPVDAVSLYTSYSIAYVPRAGDQLSSLSLSNRAIEPEQFRNYELGAKWDARPGLGVTAAVYQLTRTNVIVPDPSNLGRTLLADGQRTRGLELGASGRVAARWSLIGAYAYQDGELTSTLSATARAGATLAQVPAHTFSLWNRYDVDARWGLGLGVIHSSRMFAATDNTVVLPAFTRVDGAIYVGLTRQLRLQLNLENLLDERYFASAHSNNNITPGSPRAARLTVVTRF